MSLSSQVLFLLTSKCFFLIFDFIFTLITSKFNFFDFLSYSKFKVLFLFISSFFGETDFLIIDFFTDLSPKADFSK